MPSFRIERLRTAILITFNTQQMKKISDTHLSILLDHTYKTCQRSAAALQNALAAYIRQETLPMPLWALRQAHDDNLNRFEAILAEMERRSIP